MTNIQALGKLLRKYEHYKPKTSERMIELAKHQPLTACVKVMADLHIHAARSPKKFVEEMHEAYDAIDKNPLTDKKLTAEQVVEMLEAMILK